METMARCVNYPIGRRGSLPTDEKLYIGPQASSTPAPADLHAAHIPVPKFTFDVNNSGFKLKKHGSKAKSVIPPSPVKSAPPISRVFPHRKWAPEKAHAVSFRDGDCDSQFVDSAMYSKHYNSDKSELYFEQCFAIEQKLGEGSFGEVMKVRSRDNGKYYAVKRSREKFRSETDRRRKLDEVKKHELLPQHKNCVEFVQAWEERYRLYIQTELCSMSLQEYAENHSNISESLLWKFLIDLLRGLQHIHRHGFIHLDLKPANIFISSDNVCKIGDFGLVVDKCNIGDAREGDNKYMAPELLNSVFSTKADVFSLGIAILELASDIELPQEGLTWQLLRQGYIPPECSEKVSNELCEIIKLMLNPNYDLRPSVDELLHHPFILQKSKAKLFNTIFNKAILSFTFSLHFFIAMFWIVISKPLVLFIRPFSKRSVPIVKKNNEVMNGWKWESSSSDLSSGDSHHKLSLNGQDGQKRSLIFTPERHNRTKSRYTPTPRNSSPLNRAAMNAASMSPDVSPLSHSHHRASKVNRMRIMGEEMDYFLGDLSDSGELQDSLMSSKPRNLLDLLNEVSDSDESIGNKSDTETLFKLPND